MKTRILLALLACALLTALPSTPLLAEEPSDPSQAARKAPMTQAQIEEAIRQRKPFVNSLGMEFVWIQPGEFMAGADTPLDSEMNEFEEKMKVYERVIADFPQKAVVDKGFYLAVRAITCMQLNKLITPTFLNRFNSEDLAWNVTFEDARKFIKVLNLKEAEFGAYRMPHYLEWEYACKAGRAEPPRKPGEPHADPTPQYDKPNPWGLIGMTDGVEEWVESEYTLKYNTNVAPDELNSPVQHLTNAKGSKLEAIDSIYLSCANIMRPDSTNESGFRLAFDPK